MINDGAVEAAIADAHRREWARVLAVTARTARDLDLAEECVQEAYASALQARASAGIPANPGAWLTTTARRRAIDAIRRDAALRSRLSLLAEPGQDTEETAVTELTADSAAAIPRLPRRADRRAATGRHRVNTQVCCGAVASRFRGGAL